MSHPNRSHTRSRAPLVAALAVLFALALCAAGASAQSGRRAQKPLNLPTETPKPDDAAAAKPSGPKKAGAAVTFITMRYDGLIIGLDSTTSDEVAAVFVQRLKQVGSVELKDGGKGRRPEARERAKKETEAYVVLFQLDEDAGMTSASSDARSLVLRTYVYAPQTGDLKYSDTMYQRPYQDTARIGGVRVPVPTRRVERYPSQHQLEQAARDIADRLLSRFQITPPED